MILAQQTYALTANQIALGVIGLILVKGLDWFKEWIGYRKDQGQEKAKAEVEKGKTEFLRRIADSTESHVTELQNLTSEIRVDRAVNDERHKNNLQRMDSLCKFKGGSSQS